METKTAKTKSMDTLNIMFDLHTKLYHNVLLDLTDSDAKNRMNSKANHFGWIAGSLVQERFELAKALGVMNYQQTSHNLFKDHKGIQDDVVYPQLSEYKKDWDIISPVLRSALTDVSEEKLNGPDPFEMPGNYTLADTIVFTIDRESYCIGQIALYRRILGYDAMKYD